MKNGNILVIVVGGNISQMLVENEGMDPKLEPISEDEIEQLLIKNDTISSIKLHEANNSKGISIKINFKRLFDIANNIEQQDSSQVNPLIWSELVKKIKAEEPNNEGIVILHGLDTLAYTASAISFMVRNLNIPIVFTGSQRPLNYLRSDAPQNIYAAITFAASKSLGLNVINEVTIFLHDTLFRANRSSMSSASSYRSFDSLNFPALATIGEHVEIIEYFKIKTFTQVNTTYLTETFANVQIIDVFPGMSSTVIEGLVENDMQKIYLNNLKQVAMSIARESGEVFDESEEAEIIDNLEKVLKTISQVQILSNLLNTEQRQKALKILKKLNNKFLKSENKVRGIILRTYGMGTAPTSPEVLLALRKLVDNNIIVMNVTQAHSSRISFNSDPVSLRLFEQGVISGLDMTSEAAFAKMIIILSDVKKISKGLDYCEDELQREIAGEQTYSVINYHFNSGYTFETDSNDNNYAKLIVLNKAKEFSLREKEFNNIENIQLRILGLRKKESGAKKAEIQIVRCGEDFLKRQYEKTILITEEILKNPKKLERETINVAYDVTNLKTDIFTKNAFFYIISDQKIMWRRISFVVFF